MYVSCKDDSGFEDQITKGRLYQVKKTQNNSYTIVNDKGVEKWYGQVHFDVEFSV